MTTPDPSPEKALSGCMVVLGIGLGLFGLLVFLAFRYHFHIAFKVYLG